MKKVNFIIIGAAKSGTTTLADYLKKHPDVCFSSNKEPCIFDETHPYFLRGMSWYESLFDCSGNQILGEGSTNYTRWPQVPNVPERIFDYNPDIKLIYIMRDPVLRAYSHYIHRCLKESNTSDPFKIDFIEHVENDRMCLDSGLYKTQLDKYLEYFDQKSILLLSFKELVNNPESVIENTLSHLGLDPGKFIYTEILKSNDTSGVIKHVEREQLSQKLKSNPLIKFMSSSISNQFVRDISFKLLKNFHNKKTEDFYKPNKLSEGDISYLSDFYRQHNIDLKEAYGFYEDDWL